MAYADDTDLTARFDERVIRDLLSDSGAAVTDPLGDDPKLTALLAEASGAVDAAAQVGGFYAKADLAAMTGDGREYLAGIVCRIVMLKLMQRRPEKYASAAKSFADEVQPVLDQLQQGKLVFDIDSNLAAGRLEVTSIDGATLRQNNVLPVRTDRFYPNRSGSLPGGSQN
ncbi:MAG: hypothetical protein AAF589_03435 [Planctomycetota bacterium]